MNTQSQSTPKVLLITAELEEKNMAEACLLDVVKEIHDGSAGTAAEKLARLWNWPRVLAALLFGLKLDLKDYEQLQIVYFDHGLSKAFFMALDQVIVASNGYREIGAKINTSYQSLSERFHRVLKAVLQNFPDVELSDSEIAALELDYLRSECFDEPLLHQALVSKFKNLSQKVKQPVDRP